jgi:hypothetical protein
VPGNLPGLGVDGGEGRMIHPSELHLIMAVPAVVLSAVAVVVLVWLLTHAARYVLADKRRRPVLRTRGGSSTRGGVPPGGSVWCRLSGPAHRSGRARHTRRSIEFCAQ